MDDKLWQINVHTKNKKLYADNKRLIEMLKMGYKRLIELGVKKNKIMIQIVHSSSKEKFIAKAYENLRLPTIAELNSIDKKAKWKRFIYYYYNNRQLLEF
jgi:hypothetical protein